MALTSASGILSLLDESESDIKSHALTLLNQSVDKFWPEISDHITKIEALHEDAKFSSRELAAVLASKVHFHLDSLDDALKYALGAGKYFDVATKSEYVDTLISKCIDEYIRLKVKAHDERKKGESKESKEDMKDEVPIDPRLVNVVERMFERCFDHGQWRQALGIALETRRLDMLEKAILQSGQIKEMLAYCYEQAQKTVVSRTFREEVLRKLVQIYSGLDVPDYISMCQCLLFLDDSNAVAQTLDNLLKTADGSLMAYQVAFDLCDNENQAFLDRVSEALPKLPAPVTAATGTGAPATAGSGANPPAAPGNAATSERTPLLGASPMSIDSGSGAGAVQSQADDYPARLFKLKSILSGELPTALFLQFLYTNCKTDVNILKQIKDKLEPRNAVTHNATVLAHSFMHAGTTIDSFLRDNLEWLSKATNWAKFSATASIGVIHRGHHRESLRLLGPYLPQHGQSGSPYQEGGALYALGLIHANHGRDKIEYLLDALRNSGNNEIVQHGACLGLGLTAMATNSQQIYDVLKGIVFTENAVAGEAAGLAMGLVMLGSCNGQALEEMIAYAHDTQHEKIIRGLAMGIAMIVYGREEQSDILVEQLLTDKDPLLRYGGMFAIAMAYCATSNNSAIRRLLHVSVSDVSDDVRRAAVTALGFVLANQPEQVPKIVNLLAESYNSHVRYGACMAVGIACAGTGNKEALALLEPLCKDRVDLTRQGAMIAMAMTLIQHNEAKEPKVKAFRKTLQESIAGKTDTMTKLGAILAQGILDAGGRNVTISLLSPAGHKKMGAVVGLAMFPQFWYWYQYMHFLSLAFTPTAIIGLNQGMNLPKAVQFRSGAKPSLFAYPAPIEMKKVEEKKKVKTATLSVTAKFKARLKRKGIDDIMEVDTKEAEGAKDSVASPSSNAGPKKDKEGDVDMSKDKKDEKKGEEDKSKPEEKKDEKKAAEPEPDFEMLSNPARVTWAQQRFISYDPKQRYQPVKEHLAGFVLLRDTRPSESEELVVAKAPKVGIPGISDDEPEPPAPFEYRG